MVNLKFLQPMLSVGLSMVFLIVTGCSDYSEQSGFRVRSDFTVPLNADHGWAGEVNENVTVYADQPFRIRFEVVEADMANQQEYTLQYRRNSGTWENLSAEKFPKPEDPEVKINFEDHTVGSSPEAWEAVRGNSEGLTVASDDQDVFLRAIAGEESLMGLIQLEFPWELDEIEPVMLRIPEDNQTGAGILFGYEDPENYYRVFLDVSGSLRVSRFNDGYETVVTEKPAQITRGEWLELEIEFGNNSAEIKFQEDLPDELMFDVTFDANYIPMPVGFYIPENSTAEFLEFDFEGNARSPRVSIIDTDAYDHGEPTSDLLVLSDKPFIAGAGINLKEYVGFRSGEQTHSEWEWPLVIRRFADGAVINNEGDEFEFRMVDSKGNPFKRSVNPRLTLSIPPGHIGGTFVETPGRIGPFQAANGDLYFIIEPAETDNVLMMIKSMDNGISWSEVDGTNRPQANDLEGLTAEMTGNTIHIIHQQTNDTWHHSFRTSDHPDLPDSWDIRDRLVASHDGPPTQAVSMAIRSDGSIIAVYAGPEKIHYKKGSMDGIWENTEYTVDPGDGLILSDPQAVLGTHDEVHIAYYGNNGTAWYQRIMPDNSLTPAQMISSNLKPDPDAEEGSILPLVFIPETNTLSIIYQHESGFLKERQIVDNGPPTQPVRATDRIVVHNATDSDQAGADAIAVGSVIHMLFIEEGTGSIYHTYSNGPGQWEPSTLLIDGIYGSWVRGSLHFNREGDPVYGFVYDAGSDGGAGMNKYTSLPLSHAN